METPKNLNDNNVLPRHVFQIFARINPTQHKRICSEVRSVKKYAWLSFKVNISGMIEYAFNIVFDEV
jgi:hypothetical protein